MKPEIRFKGFTDEWVEKKLGEISDKVIKGSAKADSLELGQNTVYLDTKYLNTKSNPIMTSANANVSENDVLILWDGSNAGVVYKGANGVLGSTLKSLKINSGTSSDYVYQVLKNSESIIFDRYRTPNIPHVVKDFTRKFPIQLPSLPEQQKIGILFSKYDTIIALREQKLAELNALKKGLLQQMFPKDGVKVPELRFAGFADDWEERKLGDHAKYRRGSFPQPYGNKEWYDGEGAMPFVQVVDVTNKLTLVENTKQKISKLAQSKSVFVPKGKVVVTLQGSIGRVAVTQYDSFVDRTLLIFEDYEKETDEQFWAYTIQKKFEIEKLKAPGGTIKTITKEALSSFDVHLPKFEEQQKIGQLFKQLDARISNEQTKIAQLKAQKQGLLQRML